MSDKPIKVLMVVTNLRVSNGVAAFAINYLRKLDSKEIQMDFAVYQEWENNYNEEIKALGGRVFLLPSVKNPVAHYRMCKKLLTEGNYDIIHDNTLLITFPIMRAAKKRIPHRVLHSHSSCLGDNPAHEKRNKLFMPLLKRCANHYAACSSKAGKAMFGDKPFDIIPNVIDTERYRYNAKTREIVRKRENCTDKLVIATVGRVTEAKNPFFAVDVFESVAEKLPDAEYWWIGSGLLDERLKEYVASKKIKDRIRLFGNRNDTPDLYQAMDLFFMPSVFEGFGMVCVEAQAAGLQCVVSDTLVREVDVTGNVKFVSLNNSKREWADIIIKTLSGGQNREDPYECVRNCCFSDTEAKTLLSDYYRSLLKTK